METSYKSDSNEAFRTLIRVYFLFKIERISSNIKLTFRKTYTCPAW
jgi:hypothetical protein